MGHFIRRSIGHRDWSEMQEEEFLFSSTFTKKEGSIFAKAMLVIRTGGETISNQLIYTHGSRSAAKVLV